MKKLSFLIFFIVALTSCQGCSLFGGVKDPSQARASARAAVALMMDAWMASAETCVNEASALAVSDEAKGEELLGRCRDVLSPARESLLIAADAVDAWGAADQKDFPCLVADVVMGLKQAEDLVHLDDGPKALVDDALSLAGAYASQCQKAASTSTSCTGNNGVCKGK